jgi:hypothetical protein
MSPDPVVVGRPSQTLAPKQPLSLALHSRIAAAVLAAVPALASAQWLDYAQIEASADNASLVLVRALRDAELTAVPALLSATAARWNDGQTVAIGITPRWLLVGGEHQWLVGAGVGANYYRSRGGANLNEEAALSARAQTEFIGPAPHGSYYALLQASSFRGGAFAALQYSLHQAGVALETSYYRETTYHAYNLGLRFSLPVERWFVRVGATNDDRTRAYIGVAYNGF